jgi:glycosyltransferase involved in cell wall biosynthesis
MMIGLNMTMALSTAKRGKLKRKETLPAFRPRLVLDVELSQPLPTLRASHTGYCEALLLVRLHSCPIAQVVVPLEHSFTPDELALELWQSLAPSINTFLKRYGLAPATSLSDPRLEELGLSLKAKRDAFRSRAPFASVVICTRDCAESLERCLTSVVALDYPNFEIIVIDNAPQTDDTKRVVEKFKARGVELRYVLEPTPGLSVARNTALQHVNGEIIACLDDDEAADRYWLLELAQAFEREENVTAVSSVIVPAELETQAQVWFEEFGGHSKGRGFTPDIFNTSTHYKQSPLFPASPFGTGGSMAFKTEAIRNIGFDTTLGAGTPVQAAEDTAAFFDVLMAGQTIVYQPAAIMRHYHRRDVPSLRAQLRGYGLGLTAFYLRSLRKHPRLLLEFFALIPKALGYMFGPSRETMQTFPEDLSQVQRRAMLEGFTAYIKSCKQQALKLVES